MRTDVKDVSYCSRGSHCVPRYEMTTMFSDDGKTRVRTCIKCKDEAMERKTKAKTKSRNANPLFG